MNQIKRSPPTQFLYLLGTAAAYWACARYGVWQYTNANMPSWWLPRAVFDHRVQWWLLFTDLAALAALSAPVALVVAFKAPRPLLFAIGAALLGATVPALIRELPLLWFSQIEDKSYIVFDLLIVSVVLPVLTLVAIPITRMFRTARQFKPTE